MNLEHIAFNVAEPLAAAEWYRDRLGFRIVSSASGENPVAFIADGNGMMFEFYRRDDVSILPFDDLAPHTLHVAFTTSDLEADLATMVAAGCTRVADIETTPKGDRLVFLRDPWGLTLQLAHRAG